MAIRVKRAFQGIEGSGICRARYEVGRAYQGKKMLPGDPFSFDDHFLPHQGDMSSQAAKCRNPKF